MVVRMRLARFGRKVSGNARREGERFFTPTSGRQLTPFSSPPPEPPLLPHLRGGRTIPARRAPHRGGGPLRPGARCGLGEKRRKKRRRAGFASTHDSPHTLPPLPTGNDGHKHVGFNLDRVRYWLGVGAQPSKPVAALLAKAGVAPAPPRSAPVKTMARGVKNPDKPGRVKREA